MTTQNVTLIDNTIAITGSMTFYNAPALCTQLLEILPKERTSIVDLKQVTECDSASIVVLLQIVRFAAQHQQVIKFVNMPKAMLILSELYDLAPIFKIHKQN
jgi:anti-anti-sigma factor